MSSRGRKHLSWRITVMVLGGLTGGSPWPPRAPKKAAILKYLIFKRDWLVFDLLPRVGWEAEL